MGRRMRPQPGIGKPLDLAGPPENGTHNLAIAGLGFHDAPAMWRHGVWLIEVVAQSGSSGRPFKHSTRPKPLAMLKHLMSEIDPIASTFENATW